jgi:hypothetical protein
MQYDPETGQFRWLKPTAPRANVENAGVLCKRSGYQLIGIDRKIYKRSRLAWLWMTGAWPDLHIDHINGDTADDRWSNLREVTRSQNQSNRAKQKNNTTGHKGVYLHSQNKNYVARISVNGVTHALGVYATAEEAGAAYARAAERLHGEYARN